MATKKQSFEQPKEGSAGASKTTPGGKQSGGESSTSPGQSTSANQGASNQGGQSNQQGTKQNTGQQNTAAGQNTAQNTPTGQRSPAQGATGQNQASGQQLTGQGASTQRTQGASGQGASGQKAGEQDLLQHAKHATGEIVNQVQQQAGSQLARQKESAATDLTQVVQAVRRFGESLTGQEGGPIARYAAEYGDKAANSLERFSTYIREQDPKQLLNDVQNFGRRRPALLLGGAFLLGLAGARLIKSSMSMDSRESLHLNAPAMRPPTRPNAL